MKAALETLSRRIRSLVRRGAVVQAALNPRRTLVEVTGLAGEVEQGIELMLPFGLSALPKSGGGVVILQVLGTGSHLVALCCDDPALRIADLQSGEFGFRDYNGQQIVFRQDHLEVTTPLKLVANVTGDCDLTVGGQVNLTATGKLVAQAAEFDLTGNLNVTGSIAATGDVADGVRSMAADRAKYNAHGHGGVQTGSGTTGTPTVTE